MQFDDDDELEAYLAKQVHCRTSLFGCQ